MDLPTLIVFGPQTPWPSQEYLAQLRTTLLNDAQLLPIVHAAQSLPDLWPSLIDAEPFLAQTPAYASLAELSDWIKSGQLVHRKEAAPNSLLTPLTVIIHAVQYLQYFHRTPSSLSQIDLLESVSNAGIQGLCTGFLSAAAVACSHDINDLTKHFAVALRLAAVIGVFVDSNGIYARPAKETICFVAVWSTDTQYTALLDVLEDFPDTYVSVVKAPTGVTITTAKSTYQELSERLRTSGLNIKKLGLEGRFHHPDNEESFASALQFCESRTDLQLPNARGLLVPLRCNSDTQVIIEGSLGKIALKSLLCEQSNWHLTIAAAASELGSNHDNHVLELGLVDCFPRSVVQRSNLRIVLLNNAKHITQTPNMFDTQQSPSKTGSYTEHAIAVTGMACRFPGADSIEEFWELLCAGTSMVSEIPATRFSSKGLRRSGYTTFFGNFLRDIDSFDHKFFKISPREASSMDPQQRLVLEVAYQAMESAGYLTEKTSATSIGCYLGVGSVDYQENIGSHAPNAYSALGSLRAFISGKISHYFGWTGPSMTYDTACSSSLVAIHSACKALYTGECSTALAGGVNVITNPTLFQNLGAASFLSPTGASKAFDASADGYCRGEGCGLVVLKRLSDAIAAGDPILGVIGGSAVNQGSNATPITVPDPESQMALYRKVLSQADIDPTQVGYVEAHGTGTPRGDPIECRSIRKVFGSPNRPHKLFFGSVKGNIGHLEAASGVAGVIKSLLMIQKGLVPKQVGFRSLNPQITPALSHDRLEIPLENNRWDIDYRAICVNNYGAAGSNAALLVQQPPARRVLNRCRARMIPSKQIFRLSAHSPDALTSSITALHSFVSSSCLTLENLAFNVAWKRSHQHRYSLAFGASTLSEVQAYLDKATSETTKLMPKAKSSTKPVVLCFGGQTSDTIGLDKRVYTGNVLFKAHMDHCDSVCLSIGCGSLLPSVFSCRPIENIVNLHCSLFALQYSCAKSWIDSGLKVDALVGHSFGQLTALCVSGVLSLEDSLRFISTRALLIQNCWGEERGSMIALEADFDTVSRIISLGAEAGFHPKVEVACHNGPRSFVLAGSETDIDTINELVLSGAFLPDIVKAKKLNVTHGFHSPYAERILLPLEEFASKLRFQEPKIPLETCSNGGNWSSYDAAHLAGHTRQPVFFSDAIERLESRLGPSIWLEAGSASGIPSMVRKALSSSKVRSEHSFIPLVFNQSKAMEVLSDATMSLWKAGIDVQHWPYHRSQRYEYSQINLPPYQFEKSRHWLDYKELVDPDSIAVKSPVDTIPEGLLRFMGYQDSSESVADFVVTEKSEDFQDLVRGHAVLGNSLCPASLYIDIAAQASATLHKGAPSTTLMIKISELHISSPLGLDSSRQIHITLAREERANDFWSFQIRSTLGGHNGKETTHATGRVQLISQDDKTLLSDKRQYQRLVGTQRCTSIMEDSEAESIQGSLVYRIFSSIVDYQEYYRGVKAIYAKDHESAAVVTMPIAGSRLVQSAFCNPLVVDNFLQVAGLHVNTMRECGKGELYVCTSIRSLQMYGSLGPDESKPASWLVYSAFETVSRGSLEADIFAFNKVTGSLDLSILGATFAKVSAVSLGKVLNKINTSKAWSATPPEALKFSLLPETHPIVSECNKAQTQEFDDLRTHSEHSVFSEIQCLISRLTDIPTGDITETVALEDLGIDSLMAAEVTSEVQKSLGVSITQTELLDCRSVLSLSSLIQQKEPRILSTSSQCGRSVNNVFTPSTQSLLSSPRLGPDIEQRLSKLLCHHLGLPDFIPYELSLRDAGLDSLLSMEVQSDIQKEFGISLRHDSSWQDLNFGELLKKVEGTTSTTKELRSDTLGNRDLSELQCHDTRGNVPSSKGNSKSYIRSSASSKDVPTAFNAIKATFDELARQHGFFSFGKDVYHDQKDLVLAYALEALAELGCRLLSLKPGERIPPLSIQTRHSKVMNQIFKILEDSSLVYSTSEGHFRSDHLVDNVALPKELYHRIIRNHPQHAAEHHLLNTTGSRLAECLSGNVDPLQLLFGSKSGKDLLQQVYTNAPMFATGTGLLKSFLGKFLSGSSNELEPIQILEIGAGTGGTTKAVIDHLSALGIPFQYCFTDLSSSMITAARKRFTNQKPMEFMTLDIEKDPSPHLLGKYDVVISTNCIHATKNLVISTSNARKLLRDEGVLCLVELTRNLFWFDIVFGLLEGWWLFEDGRKHVLANEDLWKSSLSTAGFKYVDWTRGESEESNQIRLIVASNSEPRSTAVTENGHISSNPKPLVDNVQYSQKDGRALMADVYYPRDTTLNGAKRPIALVIHGGGHIMLSRKDVRPAQIQLLISQGFLPVSIDYRLCPEVSLLDGPMFDVCTALQWAREVLPTISLSHSTDRADGSKVVAVGWSTGGHLAMSLAWTAPQRGLKPPDAILAFYCPTSYGDEFWKMPNIPGGSEDAAKEEYNLWEGVRERPITAYNVAAGTKVKGAWMAPEDPRSRIALHMNWKGQTLPILTGRLLSERAERSVDEKMPILSQPSTSEVLPINPRAQIEKGSYWTPTFLVHGTEDDLIPWQQTQETYEALVSRGVPAGVRIVEGAEHLFDLRGSADVSWGVIKEAYGWLLERLSGPSS